MIYYGIFDEIKKSNMEVTESEIYDDYFATFYHKFCDKTKYDLEAYIDIAYSFNKKDVNILELACGTGRITLPLLERGFKVTAIDLSESMLNILKLQAQKLPRRINKNMTLKKLNILDIDYVEEFDMIIFPATTICLLSKDEINILFEKVYKALKIGGKFIFDYVDEKEDIFEFKKGNLELVELDKNEICMYQEFKDYKNRQAVVNFYVEKDDKKYLTSTNKRMITNKIIKEAIEKSNFNKFNEEDLDKYQSNGIIINTLIKDRD